MSSTIVNSVDIPRSPEEVFDYLSDQATELQWNPDCVSMERLTPGPVRVGTKYRAKWKQGPVVFTEVTRYDRPKAWTYENGGPISCVLTVSLEPLPDGATRLTSRGEWSAHGWMRLAFPIFIQMMRRAEKQTLANARKALAERRDVSQKAPAAGARA
jgi:uncharacterized protein YndB with AHSA1/START domain